MYFAGAGLDAVYPMGPIVDGAALNATASGYSGHLHIGLATGAPRRTWMPSRAG